MDHLFAALRENPKIFYEFKLGIQRKYARTYSEEFFKEDAKLLKAIIWSEAAQIILREHPDAIQMCIPEATECWSRYDDQLFDYAKKTSLFEVVSQARRFYFMKYKINRYKNDFSRDDIARTLTFLLDQKSYEAECIAKFIMCQRDVYPATHPKTCRGWRIARDMGYDFPPPTPETPEDLWELSNFKMITVPKHDFGKFTKAQAKKKLNEILKKNEPYTIQDYQFAQHVLESHDIAKAMYANAKCLGMRRFITRNSVFPDFFCSYLWKSYTEYQFQHNIEAAKEHPCFHFYDGDIGATFRQIHNITPEQKFTPHFIEKKYAALHVLQKLPMHLIERIMRDMFVKLT